MEKLKTENIKLRLDYKSQRNNGWPKMRVWINNQLIGEFEANSDLWEISVDINLKEHNNSLRLEHYGKNLANESNPDKFFELIKCYINEVDLKYHIHKFRQHADVPKDDSSQPPEHSHYLGHNGYLEINFDSPVDDWIRKLFNVHTDTMDGQSTTRKVLEETKEYFGIKD